MKIIKLKHEFYPFFPHKCYTLGAITPARMNTIFIRSIYGVQFDITRFLNKFHFILEID